MYSQSTISEFYCQFCNKKFLVADYNNDVEATRNAVCEHEKECRAKIKICLGDVFLFNTWWNDNNGNSSIELSPPMKVIWVDIKNPNNKQLHTVLAKYNPILKVWEEDQKAMKQYKEMYNIQYFTMYESQINRQISLSDFKESFKIVKVLSDWINETSAHSKKQCETNIGYEFDKNNILLTIKIPYKIKGRN